MDKLFEKKWFIKVGSVAIAILLFLMVNSDGTTTTTGGLPGITDGSRVIEEAQLNVYYDDENYVLTEAPETVQATLRGPQNVLTFSQVTQGQQEFFVDLTDKEPGVHYERVQHRGFPADLSISIVPMTVRVVIQEQQTVSFPVEVDIENEGMVAEGYQIGDPVVDPSTVDVRAGIGIVEQIAGARASVNVEGADNDVSGSFPVVFVDSTGTELELTANPAAVDITVPITAPNKTVPVRIGREGELDEGLAIGDISFDPSEVTIYGPVDIINDISFVDVDPLDLSGLDGSVVTEKDVIVPQGVESVDPETVDVSVDVVEEAQRVFQDYEIIVENESEEQAVTFVEPDGGVFDLTVTGSDDLLQRLERSDIQASIDVEGLEEGEHEVEVTFEGPQHLRFADEGLTVVIEIGNGDITAANNEPNDEEEEEETPESDSS